MSDNPFDQLGLKKEVVVALHARGKLENYLQSYFRLSQLHLHPDRGGDAELCTIVNSAYTEIKEHPSSVAGWISSMQNGHNEYKDMLEALVPEMERMQKENDQLRAEKAAAYAQRAGSVDAKVHTAPTPVRTPPRVDPAPHVRTPPRATATPSKTAAPKTSDEYIAGKYILMPQTSTYALGMAAIRETGKTAMTFKENIQARVEAYESSDHRLFDTWLDSCTGIAYKAGTTKFKIVPNCVELPTISKDFSSSFMPVEYAKIDSIELDSGSRLLRKTAKYNTLLTKAEILEHPAWRTAVEEDKILLKTYIDIVFNAYAAKHGASDKLMGFYVQENTATDELRALFVNYLSNFSFASGHSNLSNNGRFLARR